MAKSSIGTRPLGYQDLSIQLDDAIQKLQDPGIGIDEAAELYEQALKIIRQLEAYLTKVENHVGELKVKFAKGA